MFKNIFTKSAVAVALLAGLSGAAQAVQTDDNRSNVISGIGSSTGTPYITTVNALLDTACAYNLLALPSPDLASTRTMYAMILSAYTQSLPLKRIVYDRNATTNLCTISIVNF